ncbi:MAG: dTMP kinase [Candidatus Omnitrophica bacterium]|nr:dTMP kinase [Candidatus Omnitrophota bacterium]
MSNYTGKFITFEGSEGCGKSTQTQLLADHLKSLGVSVRLFREPGGVVISEKVRAILLDKAHAEMNRECETLLYMAARAQLVEEVVMPQLEAGAVLLCDRFLDSTVAYQGYGCGVDIEMIRTIGAFATRGIKPDLTFLLDLAVEEGLRRRGGNLDRIELRSLEYHNRVRQGYLDIARKEPGRVVVIDGRQSREEIFAIIKQKVEPLLPAA